MIPAVCSVIGLVGIISIAITVLFHFRRKRDIERQKEQAQYLEQKTNNENEENIRRYKNPLYTDKGGGTRKTSISEFHEIDVDKSDNLDKSPRRLLSGRSDSPNDSNDWKEASPQPKTKKKDINIEISQSRARVKAAERARVERELIEISRTIGADVGSEHEVMVWRT